MTFSEQYLRETALVLRNIPPMHVNRMARGLAKVRQRGGRLFVLGLGGSAAHASHAAADFRKLCKLNAICLTDNMAAFSAVANDYSWSSVFYQLLEQHQPHTNRDALLILSVGGGDEVREVSMPLVDALHGNMIRADRYKTVFAIVGREGGYAAEHADVCLIIPSEVYPHHVTPHTEGLMSVVLHCLVSHPALQVQQPKWESLA